MLLESNELCTERPDLRKRASILRRRDLLGRLVGRDGISRDLSRERLRHCRTETKRGKELFLDKEIRDIRTLGGIWSYQT
jgi:hypothetical protein